MSLPKIIKELGKYKEVELQAGPLVLRREIHILGDSKVRHLKQASSRRDEIEIKFHSYSGITSSDRKIIRNATSVSTTS